MNEPEDRNRYDVAVRTSQSIEGLAGEIHTLAEQRVEHGEELVAHSIIVEDDHANRRRRFSAICSFAPLELELDDAVSELVMLGKVMADLGDRGRLILSLDLSAAGGSTFTFTPRRLDLDTGAFELDEANASTGGGLTLVQIVEQLEQLERVAALGESDEPDERLEG